MAGLDPLLLTGRGITLGAISVGSRVDFEAMNRAIAMHRLLPVIDRALPFAEAKEAYRHFEGRGHFGKVVIAHGGDRIGSQGRGTKGSNPLPSSGESDELPPEQARSPPDLEVVRYWDLAATEWTKLKKARRVASNTSVEAQIRLLRSNPLRLGRQPSLTLYWL